MLLLGLLAFLQSTTLAQMAQDHIDTSSSPVCNGAKTDCSKVDAATWGGIQWNTLTHDEQCLWTALQSNQVDWDGNAGFVAPCVLATKCWDALNGNATQLEAAQALCFTSDTWNLYKRIDNKTCAAIEYSYFCSFSASQQSYYKDCDYGCISPPICCDVNKADHSNVAHSGDFRCTNTSLGITTRSNCFGLPYPKSCPDQPVQHKIDFTSDITAIYSISADGSEITFTVTCDDCGEDKWLGLGFSPDSTMTGHGHGSDLFVCSQGQVLRYWAVRKEQPSNGVEVPGASCAQKNGFTEMTFSRTLNTESATSLSISGAPAKTHLLYAVGSEVFLQHTVFGNKEVQLLTDGGDDNDHLLIAHMLFMVLAWMAFFPYGAASAHFKQHTKWLTHHWICQCCGLLSAGLGFLFTWLNEDAGNHFQSPQAGHKRAGVALLGVLLLQVMNSWCRPHPNSRKKREMWEYVHKGLGFLAVFGGPINVLYGIRVAYTTGLSTTFVLTAAGLAGFLLALWFGYLLTSYASAKGAYDAYRSASYAGKS